MKRNKKNEAQLAEHLLEKKHRILIVGSAPTLPKYIEKIKTFDGECWALNDAWFWLEKNYIKVSLAFITDSRFINQSIAKIESAHCNHIVTINSVNWAKLQELKKNILVLKSIGRDGFSIRPGEVFHGCSVFFTALQTAFNLGATDISICGVLLSPPGKYMRINGTKGTPEYVHEIQLRNAKKAFDLLEKFDIKTTIFEPESNLNYL